MNVEFAKIQEFPGIENTRAIIVESRFSDGSPGFGVILFDDDASESVGGIRVHRSIKVAAEYAKSLVAAT